MPCYDPPPPWEDAQRSNAEDAVKILCGMIREMLDRNEAVERRLLEWYLAHRRIDLKMAKAGWRGEEMEIEADIWRVESILITS